VADADTDSGVAKLNGNGRGRLDQAESEQVVTAREP